MQIVDERAQSAATAGLGVVHLVDDDEARDIGFFGVFPNALGDGLDAVLGIHDDAGGFNGQQRGAGFVGEHVEAGGIDEIDLDALPLGKGDGVLTWWCRGRFLLRRRR